MISLSNFLIKDKSPLININQNISDALKLLNQNDIKTLFVVKKKIKKTFTVERLRMVILEGF